MFKRAFHQQTRQLTAQQITASVIGVNAAVFLTWQYGTMELQQRRNPTILTTMKRHFTLSLDNVRRGRVWTMVTSAFSHKDIVHFGVNMFVLWNFAPTVVIFGADGACRLSAWLGEGDSPRCMHSLPSGLPWDISCIMRLQIRRVLCP
jgi:rhomboid-like protein